MTPPVIIPVTASDRRRRPMRVRFNVEQYLELWESGNFGDKRVELLDGEIYEIAAQNNPHAIGVTLAHRALERTFGPAFWVRVQATVRMSVSSAPDPDLTVVDGTPEDWFDRPLPTNPLLVVEVSESTLRLDRRKKAHIYAAAGVQEYWILRVTDRLLEVRRRPVADANDGERWDFAELIVLHESQTISPLARPDAAIAVSDLLPKLRA